MAEPDFSSTVPASYLSEVLPIAISQESKIIETFRTDINIADNARETRSGKWAAPIQMIDIGPGVRTLYTMKVIQAFWRTVYGPRDAFLFHHPEWHTTAKVASLKTFDMSPLTAVDETIGLGDGSTVDFQLQKSFVTAGGGSAAQYVYKIKGSVLVALDGVTESPANYSVDVETGILTFNSPPGSNVVISAGFDYYIAVRFDDDELALDLKDYNPGSLGVPKIILREVRDFSTS